MKTIITITLILCSIGVSAQYGIYKPYLSPKIEYSPPLISLENSFKIEYQSVVMFKGKKIAWQTMDNKWHGDIKQACIIVHKQEEKQKKELVLKNSYNL